jgi:hypothetical protein
MDFLLRRLDASEPPSRPPPSGRGRVTSARTKGDTDAEAKSSSGTRASGPAKDHASIANAGADGSAHLAVAPPGGGGPSLGWLLRYAGLRHEIKDTADADDTAATSEEAADGDVVVVREPGGVSAKPVGKASGKTGGKDSKDSDEVSGTATGTGTTTGSAAVQAAVTCSDGAIAAPPEVQTAVTKLQSRPPKQAASGSALAAGAGGVEAKQQQQQQQQQGGSQAPQGRQGAANEQEEVVDPADAEVGLHLAAAAAHGMRPRTSLDDDLADVAGALELLAAQPAPAPAPAPAFGGRWGSGAR